MKRKRVILTIITFAMLFGGIRAYGYWLDKVDAKCNFSIMVPVHVQLREEEAFIEEKATDEEALIEEKATDTEMIHDTEEPEIEIIPYDLEILTDEKRSEDTGGNAEDENAGSESVIEEE